jgi:hypothetical protein
VVFQEDIYDLFSTIRSGDNQRGVAVLFFLLQVSKANKVCMVFCTAESIRGMATENEVVSVTQSLDLIWVCSVLKEELDDVRAAMFAGLEQMRKAK